MEGDISHERADRIIALCERARRRIAKLKKHGGRLEEELEDIAAEWPCSAKAKEARRRIKKLEADCGRLEEELALLDSRVVKCGQDALLHTPAPWLSE